MADYQPQLVIVLLSLWIITATESHSIHDSNSQVANVTHKRFTRTITTYEFQALKQRYGKMSKPGLIAQIQTYETQLSTLQNTYCALTANLEYCTAKYDACYTEYKEQTVLLNDKQTVLAQCTTDLTTCQATLSALETSLATATATLATCQANYATCDANYKLLDMTYQQCLADKATCDAALIACEAALTVTCNSILNGLAVTQKGTSWYYYFAPPTPVVAVAWNSARAKCAEYGMDLAQIGDATENANVAQFLASQSAPSVTTNVYIGANDIMKEGSYTWVPDSDPVTNINTFLSGSSAANTLNNNCVVMRTTGLWYRSVCTSNTGYVCEVKPQCQPYVTAAG